MHKLLVKLGNTLNYHINDIDMKFKVDFNGLSEECVLEITDDFFDLIESMNCYTYGYSENKIWQYNLDYSGSYETRKYIMDKIKEFFDIRKLKIE